MISLVSVSSESESCSLVLTGMALLWSQKEALSSSDSEVAFYESQPTWFHQRNMPLAQPGFHPSTNSELTGGTLGLCIAEVHSCTSGPFGTHGVHASPSQEHLCSYLSQLHLLGIRNIIATSIIALVPRPAPSTVGIPHRTAARGPGTGSALGIVSILSFSPAEIIVAERISPPLDNVKTHQCS